jgi:hypothetical protein
LYDKKKLKLLLAERKKADVKTMYIMLTFQMTNNRIVRQQKGTTSVMH